MENTTQQPLKMKWAGPKELEILFSLNRLAMNKNGAKLQVQAEVSWIPDFYEMGAVCKQSMDWPHAFVLTTSHQGLHGLRGQKYSGTDLTYNIILKF